MKLLINDKADMTLYTHHSLPLLIPFISPKTEGWYMNNFINIFYRYEYPSFYDYTDYKCFYSGIMDIDTFTYSTALCFNTIDFFTECISSNKYIYAWVDQYYISATPFYENKHDIHPILIYGYDLKRSVYHCKCFSIERGVYSADVVMSEYHQALLKAMESDMHINDDDVFCIFKVRNDLTCEFSLESFVSELNDYATGRGKHKGAYFFKGEHIVDSKYHYDLSCYGLKVTELLADGLLAKHLRCFDYRVLHMVCENKKNILKRLQYVSMRYANYDIRFFDLCVDEYAQIAGKYEKIRLLAMKKSVSENHDLYNIIYREETARKLQIMLYELIEQERGVLIKILRELAGLHMSESFAYKNIQKAMPDQNRDCVFIDDDCYIEGIVIYAYDRIFMGTLIVDENTIRIDDTRAGNVYYYPIHQKVSKCIWHPSLPMKDDEDAIMCVVKGWSSTCKYIPSTTYPTDPPFIKADNLGELADNFWCPDVNDPEPFVELHFETPTIVDTLVVIQHYVERRVAEIQIEAWVDEGWNVISTLKQLNGRQIITVKFDTITSEKFKVKFTKRIRSENGFDIPNILYMRVFKDNAS